MAEIRKKQEDEIKKAPKYDPTEVYQWQPSDEFVLDGQEFTLLYQVIKSEVLIPGGTSIKQKMEVFNLLEDMLRKAVEAGIATVYIPPSLADIPIINTADLGKKS